MATVGEADNSGRLTDGALKTESALPWSMFGKISKGLGIVSPWIPTSLFYHHEVMRCRLSHTPGAILKDGAGKKETEIQFLQR